MPLLQKDFISMLPVELALHILSFTDVATLGRAAQVCRYWSRVAAENHPWKALYFRRGWSVNDAYLETLQFPVQGSGDRLPSSPTTTPAPATVASASMPTAAIADQTGAASESSRGSASGNPRPLTQSSSILSLAMMATLPSAGLRDHLATADASETVAAGSGPLAATSAAASSSLAGLLGGPHSQQQSLPVAVPVPHARTERLDSILSDYDPSALDATMLSGSSQTQLQLVDQQAGSQVQLETMLGTSAQSFHMFSPPAPSHIDLPSNTGAGPSHASNVSHHAGLGSMLESPQTDGNFGGPFRPASSVAPTHLDWKNIFYQRLVLETNFYKGAFVSRDIQGHEEAVYCLQFDEDKIISGSRDHNIKVWDMKTGACRKTVGGHVGSVLCLQYNSQYLVTGSSDSTLIIWDVATFERIRTLTGHLESVLNFRFDNQVVVSCSKDKMIKIWSTQTGQMLRTLRGHRAAINAVQYENGLIVSASGDRTIKVWSKETGALIRTLTGHLRGIACVQFDGNIIVSGSSDKSIRVWDVHTGQMLKVLTGHTDLVRTLQFQVPPDYLQRVAAYNQAHPTPATDAATTPAVPGADTDDAANTPSTTRRLLPHATPHLAPPNSSSAAHWSNLSGNGRIVSGSYDTTIKIWDATTGAQLLEFAGVHDSRVYKLQFSQTKIVSCSQDMKIIVWDFAHGLDARLFDS
ncbi:WD40-repeat-containing domain protein [Entophlyctis helioformis]|nr:WD40-repeat-containing domain protein [Entophlyctis helioformis]